MNPISAPAQPTAGWMVMTLSTVAFTLLFKVWLMLGVLAPKIKESVGLGAAQVEWLIATAILSRALLRLNFGVWADRYGGRNVMVALLLLTAVPTYLFGWATTYAQLLACTLLFGLAGNAFTAGVAWNEVAAFTGSEPVSGFREARGGDTEGYWYWWSGGQVIEACRFGAFREHQLNPWLRSVIFGH